MEECDDIQKLFYFHFNKIIHEIFRFPSHLHVSWPPMPHLHMQEVSFIWKYFFCIYSSAFSPTWRHRRRRRPRRHPLGNVLLKKSVFALKIDLQLVLFHSICRTLWACPQRDGELCIFCVCYVGWVCGGVWKRFTRLPCSHWPIFLFFFPPWDLSLNLVLIIHSYPA